MGFSENFLRLILSAAFVTGWYFFQDILKGIIGRSMFWYEVFGSYLAVTMAAFIVSKVMINALSGGRDER